MLDESDSGEGEFLPRETSGRIREGMGSGGGGGVRSREAIVFSYRRSFVTRSRRKG